MQIRYNFEKRTLILKVTGDLDHHCAADVREFIDGELTKGKAKNLIFDFSELNFMDSSGIGVILGRYRLVKNMGGNMLIASVTPAVDRILLLSGIHKIMPVAKNVNLAIEMI